MTFWRCKSVATQLADAFYLEKLVSFVAENSENSTKNYSLQDPRIDKIVGAMQEQSRQGKTHEWQKVLVIPIVSKPYRARTFTAVCLRQQIYFLLRKRIGSRDRRKEILLVYNIMNAQVAAVWEERFSKETTAL